MNLWKIEKIEELKSEITNLLEQESKLLTELKINTSDKKSVILEKFKPLYNQIKLKYRELKTYNEEEYNSEINEVLKKQIENYEHWLKILTEKVRVEEIDFFYFLELANLKYEFFDLNRKEIINKAKKHEGVFIGASFIPVSEIDTITYNIHLAMKNVEKVIQEKRQTLDYKTLYIYFELYGDLFISIHALETEIDEFSVSAALYNIDNAFDCYEEASEYKSKIELPSIALVGLTGVEYIKPFFNFFESLGGNMYDVNHKKNYVYEKYANYLQRKTKSYCWRTGNNCEFKKEVIYTLNEGNGVFISMNYSKENNFKLLSYIEKILNYYKLKPILKQERIRSPSWTKEICCTIYDNKYSIVFLDIFSPNVVLELGVCFGMGRKTIILVNESNNPTPTEKMLFSMIKDYDCITYKNTKELFEKLVRSINGLFFNNLDYEIPEITTLFNENDVKELENIIQNYWN